MAIWNAIWAWISRHGKRLNQANGAGPEALGGPRHRKSDDEPDRA